MSTIEINGITQYYETHGDAARPAVLLISGLGGIGASWATQVHRLAQQYFVILPDQRGTGRTTHADSGYSTEQLAADMVALVEHLATGPVHVVGSSTGGAIGQHIALSRPDLVASLSLSSSFARFDAYMDREFAIRRRVAIEWDRKTQMATNALFLFSPRFTDEHPDVVEQWIDRAASAPTEPNDVEITVQRIDMVAAHDTADRVGEITAPTLVLSGTANACTTLPNSEFLARSISGARLITFEQAGELIDIEREVDFFTAVSTFIDEHAGQGAAGGPDAGRS